MNGNVRLIIYEPKWWLMGPVFGGDIQKLTHFRWSQLSDPAIVKYGHWLLLSDWTLKPPILVHPIEDYRSMKHLQLLQGGTHLCNCSSMPLSWSSFMVPWQRAIAQLEVAMLATTGLQVWILSSIKKKNQNASSMWEGSFFNQLSNSWWHEKQLANLDNLFLCLDWIRGRQQLKQVFTS